MATTRKPTTQDQPPHKPTAAASVFSASQLQRLQLILGSRFDRALPGLEEGVRRYDPALPVEGDDRRARATLDARRRESARATANLAKELEGAADLFAGALEKMEPFIKDAFLAGDFPINTLADLARVETPEQRWTRTAEILAQTRGRAIWIRDAACQWRNRKNKTGAGKRGRPRKTTINLSGWVGYALAKAGIKLTCGKAGRWARVARVVYQAAELHVPPKLFDDRLLSHDIEFLREYIPADMKRNSQQKTPRRIRVK